MTDAELAAARDYLVGVFPLRFETPGAVVGALGGLFVHDLPDDELARYRDATEAVTVADVQAAAREHIDLDRIAVVAVGDADAIGGELESAGLGEVEIVDGQGRRRRGDAADEAGRMIVVVGLPAYADGADGEECAGGLAVEVAAAAVARGGTVELVGKVGNDGAGDAVVLALGRLGIGHAALLRDPARPTPVLTETPLPEAADECRGRGLEGPEVRLLPADPAARPVLEAADVELALRYLPEAAVIVLADPLPESTVEAGIAGRGLLRGQVDRARAAGGATRRVPPETTVLEAPEEDDGSFGRLVGAFAGALDAGVDPAVAFGEAVTLPAGSRSPTEGRGPRAGLAGRSRSGAAASGSPPPADRFL